MTDLLCWEWLKMVIIATEMCHFSNNSVFPDTSDLYFSVNTGPFPTIYTANNISTLWRFLWCCRHADVISILALAVSSTWVKYCTGLDEKFPRKFLENSNQSGLRTFLNSCKFSSFWLYSASRNWMYSVSTDWLPQLYAVLQRIKFEMFEINFISKLLGSSFWSGEDFVSE